MKCLMITTICSILLLLAGSFYPSTLEAQTVAEKRISQNELVQMLDNIGLDPKKTSDYWANIKWHGEKLDFTISCGVKENGDYIYLESYLRAIENPDAVSAQAWRKILATNDNIGRCTFSFDEKNKKLYLSLKIANNNMNASKLRNEVTTLAKHVESTQNIWYNDHLQTANKVSFLTSPSPFRMPTPISNEKVFSLEGKWFMTAGIQNGMEKTFTSDDKQTVKITITSDEMVAEQNGKVILKRKYKVNNSNQPTTIDWIDDKGVIELGLVQFNNANECAICFPDKANHPRPTEFGSTQQNNQSVMKLRRVQ